jgi:kynurenine formamidase
LSTLKRNLDTSIWNEDRVLALFSELSNQGRWGVNDERGTLNFITEQTRIEAALEVKIGRSISISRIIDTVGTPANPLPARHRMHYYGADAISCGDSLDITIHGMATTHLDAVGHESFDHQLYNGRSVKESVLASGLHWANIMVQREGIFARGVLLDVCAARDLAWLEPGDRITDADLVAAEALAGTEVRSGDVVVVHSGFDRALKAGQPAVSSSRAGLGPECLAWLHDRQAAVFAGDCIEQLPSPYPRVPFPLHQVGLAAMGLVLLDSVMADQLVDLCRAIGRQTFLFTAAPLLIPNGTGSPVNPICTF